ncbi:uncharacterized protein YjbJ (UPF0337 family) [Streptomyces achromogenes]|uniref:hypothetical protein n=1 Tax=Streptomyces achromogenes TaxID=67255 RepID=UPI00278232A6|nr:hypothetical protein [Streptomyces achromogenes]MDQ0828598.1 uncharacterized protein YjbJ (UPF0337 family) [Streptomyces achromogenes]
MSEAAQGDTTRLQQTGETARAEASATAGQAQQAAGQVADTAREQARAVAGEARQQVGTVVDDLRSRAMDEAEGQTRRAAGTLHQWADDLAGLADNAQGDSPARSLAAQAADGGHRAADYLEKQGVDGVLGDVQDFARRRPAAFLGGALLAGFAVGRLVKVAAKADRSNGAERQRNGEAPDRAALGDRGTAALSSAASPGAMREQASAVQPAPPRFPPSVGVAPGEAPDRPGRGV